MTKLILTALLAVAGLAPIAAPAYACPHGYKRVWIQGNPVCQLDVSASNKLKAATGTPPAKSLKLQQPRRR